MNMGNASLEDIRLALLGAQKIMVTSHLRPDGDAIGSLLGMGLALENAGKNVQMVLVDGVPANYRFLAGSDKIKHKSEGEYDLVVVLDCSDLQRVAGVLDESRQPDLNIDHHITNHEFARLNWVDHTAVATSEILYNLLRSLDFPILPVVANALLTGILADSIGFRTSNMTPAVLRAAANLMEEGADLPELYQLAILRRSYNAVRFWGYGLTNLHRQDGLVWAVLSMADRELAGYSGKDDADLVNMLSLINDAEIAIVFVEQPDGKVKISWRAINDHDVSILARQYHGGGHRAAAGAMIEGSLLEVATRIVDETYHYIVETSAKESIKN
jgi:phosphoesterase RecJ-like protein